LPTIIFSFAVTYTVCVYTHTYTHIHTIICPSLGIAIYYYIFSFLVSHLFHPFFNCLSVSFFSMFLFPFLYSSTFQIFFQTTFFSSGQILSLSAYHALCLSVTAPSQLRPTLSFHKAWLVLYVFSSQFFVFHNQELRNSSK
jgi:hypothetical protein